MGSLLLILALIFLLLGYGGIALILLILGLVFFFVPAAPYGRWPYGGPRG